MVIEDTTKLSRTIVGAARQAQVSHLDAYPRLSTPVIHPQALYPQLLSLHVPVFYMTGAGGGPVELVQDGHRRTAARR